MFDIFTLFTVKYIKIEDSKTTPEKDVPYSVTVSALNSRNAAVELNNSVFDMIARNFRFNDEFKVNGCDVGGAAEIAVMVEMVCKFPSFGAYVERFETIVFYQPL